MKIFFIAATSILLTGCSSFSPAPVLSEGEYRAIEQETAQRLKESQREDHRVSDQLAAEVRAACHRRGGVALGMTQSRVRSSCYGEPADVYQTVTSSGTVEVWDNRRGDLIFFRDGRVISTRFVVN